MSWTEIIGHESNLQRFRISWRNQRLANTYLFVGREGIGKRKFALKLAQTLFCKTGVDQFEPCGRCDQCTQVLSATHPDLILISKPKDKNFLPVELFVGDREHRRRAGLCHDINLTPFNGLRKIAVIDDADFFNAESANSLLKILEEPPNNSILILIGTSEQRQLPTILSRCQVVRFQALVPDQVSRILEDLGIEAHVSLGELATVSGGSVSRAIELNDQELFSFRRLLFEQLATLDPADNNFSKTVCDYVDGQSKDSAVKRRYMNLLAEFAIQFFSDALHASLHIQTANQSRDHELVEQMLSNDSSGRFQDALSDLIERTMVLQKHVDANLSMANIVPAWLNDLGALARGEKHLATAPIQ